MVWLGATEFFPDLTGVGVGLKLCFFSTEVCTRSFDKLGMLREKLYLPELPPITAGVFKKVFMMCFR